MKKEKIKNIIIVILILVIIIMIIINIFKFTDNLKAINLFKSAFNMQSSVSEYIGKTKSDTFDVYTTEQILLGSTNTEDIETTKIKNNEDEDLIQIVTLENKISQDETTFYKINTENFKKQFDVDLYDQDGIIWYLQNNGDIKVSYQSKPSWWTKDLEAIYIGK